MPGKEVKCLSQIADGKLYYIYEDTSTVYEDTSLIYMDPSIPTNGHNSYVAVFDLLTMQSVDLCEISYHYTIGKGYVYGDYYYYYRSINIVEPRGQLCRIPLLGGEEEVVKDFEGEEELFMIADGEIITINTSSEVSADTVTEISVIKSYNIETGNERMLWNGEIAKDKWGGLRREDGDGDGFEDLVEASQHGGKKILSLIGRMGIVFCRQKQRRPGTMQ